MPIVYAQEWATRRGATRLIGALQAYHRARGRYPDSLAQLAPRYYPDAAPSTHFGWLASQPYWYQRLPDQCPPAAAWHPDAFLLRYEHPPLQMAQYTSGSGSWASYYALVDRPLPLPSLPTGPCEARGSE